LIIQIQPSLNNSKGLKEYKILMGFHWNSKICKNNYGHFKENESNYQNDYQLVIPYLEKWNHLYWKEWYVIRNSSQQIKLCLKLLLN
jgi:hypothetical protein